MLVRRSVPSAPGKTGSKSDYPKPPEPALTGYPPMTRYEGNLRDDGLPAGKPLKLPKTLPPFCSRPEGGREADVRNGRRILTFNIRPYNGDYKSKRTEGNLMTEPATAAAEADGVAVYGFYKDDIQQFGADATADGRFVFKGGLTPDEDNPDDVWLAEWSSGKAEHYGWLIPAGSRYRLFPFYATEDEADVPLIVPPVHQGGGCWVVPVSQNGMNVTYERVEIPEAVIDDKFEDIVADMNRKGI